MRSTAPIDKVLKAATDRGDVPGVVAMAANRDGLASGYVQNSVTRAPRSRNPFYDSALALLLLDDPTDPRRAFPGTFISVSENGLVDDRHKPTCFQ